MPGLGSGILRGTLEGRVSPGTVDATLYSRDGSWGGRTHPAPATGASCEALDCEEVVTGIGAAMLGSLRARRGPRQLEDECSRVGARTSQDPSEGRAHDSSDCRQAGDDGRARVLVAIVGGSSYEGGGSWMAMGL